MNEQEIVKVYRKRSFWQWITRKPKPYDLFFWSQACEEENSGTIIEPNPTPETGRWIKQDIKLPWYKRLFEAKIKWFGAEFKDE